MGVDPIGLGLGPAAERYPARASEIRRFGAKVKFLQRARVSTTDSSSFTEVVREEKMDRHYQGNRDGRESKRNG